MFPVELVRGAGRGTPGRRRRRGGEDIGGDLVAARHLLPTVADVLRVARQGGAGTRRRRPCVPGAGGHEAPGPGTPAPAGGGAAPPARPARGRPS